MEAEAEAELFQEPVRPFSGAVCWVADLAAAVEVVDLRPEAAAAVGVDLAVAVLVAADRVEVGNFLTAQNQELYILFRFTLPRHLL